MEEGGGGWKGGSNRKGQAGASVLRSSLYVDTYRSNRLCSYLPSLSLSIPHSLPPSTYSWSKLILRLLSAPLVPPLSPSTLSPPPPPSLLTNTVEVGALRRIESREETAPFLPLPSAAAAANFPSGGGAAVGRAMEEGGREG